MPQGRQPHLRSSMVRITVALSALLAACGGSPPEGPTTPREPTTWVIGTSGGTIHSQNGNVTVTVPPGALPGSLGITVLPADGGLPTDEYVPGSGYEIGPTGTVFSKPVTISIKFDPAQIPPGIDPRALRLQFAQGGKWVAVPRSDVDLTTNTVTGETLHFTPFGAAQSQVDSLIFVLRSDLASLGSSAADVARAVTIKLRLAELFSMSDRPEYQDEVPKFLDEVATIACAEYKRYASNAPILIVDADYGTLNSLLTPVLDWYAVKERAGGACGGAPDLAPAVDAVLGPWTQHYVKELGNADPRFGLLLQEFTRVVGLIGLAAQLDLGATVTQLTNEAQNPLAVKLRSSAFANCRLRSRQASPAFLLGPAASGQLPYSVTDVVQDIEWCATQLSWELLSSDRTVRASGVLGGSQPGSMVTTVTQRGSATGSFVLSGAVEPLRCVDGTINDGEELSIVMPNYVVEFVSRIRTGGNLSLLPGGSFEIPLSRLVRETGIDPSQAGSITLWLLRTSSACNGFYGVTGTYQLATIKLTFPEVTVTVSPASAMLNLGSEQLFTATVTGATNTAVTWGATGGTIDNTGRYTAGSAAGSYTVTATSVADPTSKSTANVTATANPDVEFIRNLSLVAGSVPGPGGSLEQDADPFSKSFSGSVSKSGTVSKVSGSITATGSNQWTDVNAGGILATITGRGFATGSASTTSSTESVDAPATARTFIMFDVKLAAVTIAITSSCQPFGDNDGQYARIQFGPSGQYVLDILPPASNCNGDFTVVVGPGRYWFVYTVLTYASTRGHTSRTASGNFTVTIKR